MILLEGDGPTSVLLPSADAHAGRVLRVTPAEGSGPVVVYGAIGGARAVDAVETFRVREFAHVGAQWCADSDVAAALGLYDPPAPFNGNLYVVHAYTSQGELAAGTLTTDDVTTWVRDVYARHGLVPITVCNG